MIDLLEGRLFNGRGAVVDGAVAVVVAVVVVAVVVAVAVVAAVVVAFDSCY